MVRALLVTVATAAVTAAVVASAMVPGPVRVTGLEPVQVPAYVLPVREPVKAPPKGTPVLFPLFSLTAANVPQPAVPVQPPAAEPVPAPAIQPPPPPPAPVPPPVVHVVVKIHGGGIRACSHGKLPKPKVCRLLRPVLLLYETLGMI